MNTQDNILPNAASSLTTGSQSRVNPVDIGGRRECFFDDFLLDRSRTSMDITQHHPHYKDTVLLHDAEWDGDGNDFYNFFFDDQNHGVDGSYADGTYRMYYLAWQMPHLPEEKPSKPERGIVVAYLESPDGIHWLRPALGIVDWNGIAENNIVWDAAMNHSNIDNFMVFRDDNPACPPEERYKAIGYSKTDAGAKALYFNTSPDGTHFTRGGIVTTQGNFDSLNVAFWDAEAKKYRCYFRSFHPHANPDITCSIRAISTIESTDFRNWSEPRLIQFDDDEDIPLYTNNVMPYFRAPHILVGSPTRYIERRLQWTGNYDELRGSEKRKLRMALSPRYGLAITDCIFMSSRDGLNFHRFGEAFMRPEPENGKNWVYGDCYPARGLAVVPGDFPGADDQLAFYVPIGHWMDESTRLLRYTIRLDGFASLHAGAKEPLAVTRPLTYSGSELHVNFATSAMGFLCITMVDADGNRYPACETFGNATDRKIVFDAPAAVARLAGSRVTLEFRMRDGDLYSLQFR